MFRYLFSGDQLDFGGNPGIRAKRDEAMDKAEVITCVSVSIAGCCVLH